MRIAFLCKRRYMGKDVVLDRYARLYEIPHQLAKLGHDVRGYCLDYHAQSEGEWAHEVASGSLIWESQSLDRLRLPSLFRYPQHLLRQLRLFSPDILFGASDIPHVVLTSHLARRLNLPYAIDLYDNFEGFGQARIPGFVSALRMATRRAQLVTTTSDALRQLVLDSYGSRGTVISMPSSVDKSVFRPQDRKVARERLGLPEHGKLIGTAGGLHREKGIQALYEGWEAIAAARPDVHLVLAGPFERRFPPPRGERIHYLGHLEHARVAELFNALDVGVISVLDTPFGRYCFPQKAYEMLACGLPIVAADVGATANLFTENPEVLFPAGDPLGLVSAIERQFRLPLRSKRSIPDWTELIGQIEPGLKALPGSFGQR